MFEEDSDEDIDELSDRLKVSSLEGEEGGDGGGGGFRWSEADMTTVTPCLSIVQVAWNVSRIELRHCQPFQRLVWM